jgi:hypothetical protein
MRKRIRNLWYQFLHGQIQGLPSDRLNSLFSPLAEGQWIQYNFVKPHIALVGQTPAQRAGIEIEGRNK